MKRKIYFLFSLLLFANTWLVHAQTNCSATACYYFMQVGPPVVLDCSKTNNFYDPQVTTTTTPPASNGAGFNCSPPSAASNYNYTDIANVTQTFQTNNGQCLTANFNLVGPFLFGLSTGDTLYMYDGPTLSSPLLAFWTNTTTQPSATYTSSSNAGLTFHFVSDNATNCKGWACRFGCVTCPSAPSNDPCSGAQQLLPGASCTYTPGLINAPTNPTSTAPACGGSIPNGNDDVWYYFSASNSTATITVAPSAGMDPVIQLLSGTCGSLTQVGSCQNATGTGGSEVLTASGLTTGATYYVRIFDFQGGSGSGSYSFNVCVQSSANVDCAAATQLCSSSAVNGTFIWNNYGTQEFSSGTWGCILYGESCSAWYYFKCETAGTLGFNIASSNGTAQDIDWALWGPYSAMACPMSLSPIRCSYAGQVQYNSFGMPNYSTGLQASETDITEPAGYAAVNPAFVDTVHMKAGKYYVLLLNLWSGNLNYQITWQLADGGTLNTCLLPLELITFDGEDIGDVNHLYWTTESEINNDHFILERSADGANFEQLGTINGAGNTSALTNYDYYDQHPLTGINYYRLRQVDNDGEYTFSEIISLENKVVAELSLAVYPNPTAGIFNVGLTAPEDCDVAIDILNELGQMVQTMKSEVHNGRNNIQLDLTSFDHGIYTVRVRACDAGKVFTKKIVKI